MIKNIIFDIGGVLLHSDHEAMCRKFSEDPLDISFLYNEALMSPEWLGSSLIDYGYITVEEAIAQIQDRTHHLHDSLVENFLLHCHEGRPVAKNVMSRIKQLKSNGYKIYLLSNSGPKMIEWLRQACDIFDIVDGYILSCEVHQVKPNPSIYKTLLAKYKLVPGECLFIDDNKDNINMSKELGMQAHLVKTNSEQAVLDAISGL